jgi:plastocyanin
MAAAAAACTTSGSGASVTPSVAAPSAAPSSAAVSASAASEQTISLYEWKVIAATTLKPGTAKFTITNFGTQPHELLVFKSDLAPSAYPTDAAGDIVEDGPGVSLVSDGENIDPSGTQTRSVDLTPGTYLFVCNIPGHFKQGMFSTVTVTP